MMENLPYKAADGTMANEILYSVRQGADIFSVAIVDLSRASVDETNALDSAINLLRETGEIRLDIPARVSRHRGRQLSIAGKDGSHSVVAIFFADHRLYQIQGTVLPESDDPSSGDAIRFQQSLRFTGDNRGPRFGPGFAGRQFRGGQRFRQNQAPADQTPPVSVP
jgi:hypothetical protein